MSPANGGLNSIFIMTSSVRFKPVDDMCNAFTPSLKVLTVIPGVEIPPSEVNVFVAPAKLNVTSCPDPWKVRVCHTSVSRWIIFSGVQSGKSSIYWLHNYCCAAPGQEAMNPKRINIPRNAFGKNNIQSHTKSLFINKISGLDDCFGLFYK